MTKEIRKIEMPAEEFKEQVIHRLGMAGDCEETMKIISDYLQIPKSEHLPNKKKADYLLKLKEELKSLSHAGFDYIHWCNIQCAILYLRKQINKHQK